jgi:hypothetical protein
MDTDAIIATALDIIADESTLKNDMGEVLSIKSSDEDVQKVLYPIEHDFEHLFCAQFRGYLQNGGENRFCENRVADRTETPM